MNVPILLAPPGIATLEFDTDFLSRLDPCAASYWLYPGVAQFHGAHSQAEITRNYAQAAQRASRSSRGSQSLATLCLHLAQPLLPGEAQYPPLLRQEIGMQGDLLGKLFQVDQLQLRGCIRISASLPALLAEVRQHFLFSRVCQYQVEIDVNPDTAAELGALRDSGFSHLQLTVRNHGNSAREAHQTAQVIVRARKLAFASISITVTFGPPQQTMLSLARILKQIIEVQPDRIVLRANRPANQPGTGQPGNGWQPQLCWCINHLHAAQYHHLGSYVFAKVHDPLARAQLQGRLHRGLYGYAQQNENNHIGCGLAAVSCLGNVYTQNHSDFTAYRQQLLAHQLPLARDLHLSMDDLLRRIIMHMLLCNFELSIAALELSYPISFRQYFAHEWLELQKMEQQKWLTLDEEWLLVQARGRLFIDQICTVFDHYAQPVK